MNWVLVGELDGRMKAFGPFDEADDARELANAIGMTGVSWSVLPLQMPSGA